MDTQDPFADPPSTISSTQPAQDIFDRLAAEDGAKLPAPPHSLKSDGMIIFLCSGTPTMRSHGAANLQAFLLSEEVQLLKSSQKFNVFLYGGANPLSAFPRSASATADRKFDAKYWIAHATLGEGFEFAPSLRIAFEQRPDEIRLFADNATNGFAVLQDLRQLNVLHNVRISIVFLAHPGTEVDPDGAFKHIAEQNGGSFSSWVVTSGQWQKREE